MPPLQAIVRGMGAAAPLQATAPDPTGLEALRQGLSGEISADLQTTEFREGARPLALTHYRAACDRLADFLPRRALRRLDHVTRLSLLAAHRAFQDAGLPASSDAERATETGLVVGTGHGPLAASFAFQDSLIDDGDRCASPQAFAGSVHNALAAQVSLSLNLQGPCLTLTLFEHTTAAALQTAALWLAEERARRVLVLFADEFTPVLGWSMQRLAAETRGVEDSTPPCREIKPFDFQTYSCVPGEGAVAFVLEPASTRDQPARARLQPQPMLPRDEAASFCASADALALAADGDARTGPHYRRLLHRIDRSSAPRPAVLAPAPLYGSLPTGSAFTVATAILLLEGATCAAGFLHAKESAGTEASSPAVPARADRLICAAVGANDGLVSTVSLSHLAD